MAEQIAPEIDTILWDLDGTLLDSLGVLEGGLATVLPKYQRQLPSHETIAMNFHGSLEDSIRNMLGDVSDEELAAIINDFLVTQDTYYDVVQDHLYKDAVELARQAHSDGKQQVLVTNRAHEGRLKASPRSIVEHSELREYIDKVICGDDSEHRKPSPAVLGAFLETLDAERTLVIGDQFVDAQFAHNLGATAILVDRQGSGIAHLETLDADAAERYRVVVNL